MADGLSIRRFLRALIAVFGLFLAGLSASTPALAQSPFFDLPEMRLEARATQTHAGERISWFLDRRGKTGRQGVLLLAQGSGCADVTQNLNLALAAATLRPGDAVVLVQKPGVARGAAPADPMADCTPEFRKEMTVSRRVADAAAVLDALKREGWWNGRLTLFGGSEGGAVVAELAPLRRERPSVVVFSTGVGEPLAKSLVSVVPPQVRAGLEAQLADIRANPAADKIMGGNSYRWWADIMDKTLADDLGRTRGRVLLVHGELDQQTPVSGARLAAAALQKARGRRFTYLEKPGLEHQMRDVKGESQLKPVLLEIEAWLAKR